MVRKYWVAGAAVILVLIMITQVVLSMMQESVSWDEGDHIFSGYMNWKHGEYDLNPEHPPFVKLVATLPLVPLDLKIPPREGRYFKSEAYYGGRALLFHNGPGDGGHYTVDSLLFRVHAAVMVFAVALAILLFLAGREMFSAEAGLIALTIFVFDPTVLVNAPFVTTDTGAAFGFFASVYTFYRFVKKVTWARIVICGVAIGIALGSKHSVALLLPILLLLGAGEIAGRWKVSGGWPRQDANRILLGMGAIAALSIFVLWGIYGFRFAMHPEGVAMRSFAQEAALLSPKMRAILTFFERFHLLPESYIYGFADVQQVADVLPAYFFGKIYVHGMWYYFPVMLSLKWSVGVLGLLALAIYAFATGKVRRPREVFFLVLPAVFYLGVAMSSPLNIGVRHSLPVFPFVFALIGGGAAWLIQRKRVWIVPVAALLLWHVVDSVRMFPNYLPYGNELYGGPAKTHLYFTDSATEWGEELKWVKQWADAHNVKQCWFAYSPAPFLLPADYGLPCKLLPTFDSQSEIDLSVPAVVHGPILVSYPDLNGYEFGTRVLNPYQSLFERKPDEVIANAVAVYYGDFALPDAAAMQYVRHGRELLKTDPQQALAYAREAVAVSPQGFSSNWLLGDALVANGDPGLALAPLQAAMRHIPEMEPGAGKLWGANLEADYEKASVQARLR